jgi:hypothetical protein
MILNPLIIACLVGIAYGRTVGAFTPFVRNLFQLLSSGLLALALLSDGVQPEFGPSCSIPPGPGRRAHQLAFLPAGRFVMLRWLGCGRTLF